MMDACLQLKTSKSAAARHTQVDEQPEEIHTKKHKSKTNREISVRHILPTDGA